MRKIDQLAAIIHQPVKSHRIARIEKQVISWQEDHRIEIEEDEIAIHGEKMAWLERHYQSLSPDIEADFKLKALVHRDLVVDWDVRSYNPAFGCSVYLLRWFEDTLVFVYHEKHDIYACNFNAQGIQKIVCVSHEIAILKDQLFYRHWDEMDQVHILHLPDLELLETISHADTLANGIRLSELCDQNWYRD